MFDASGSLLDFDALFFRKELNLETAFRAGLGMLVDDPVHHEE